MTKKEELKEIKEVDDFQRIFVGDEILNKINEIIRIVNKLNHNNLKRK